jgi:chemotaxis protein histidine kinase CheA
LPKFRVPDEDMDIKELEEAEFDEEGQFKPYTGKQPPKGTILRGIIKKAWMTETNAGKLMLKVIFEATEESGEYEGLGIWDNIAFQPNTKFRWKPFLDATGLTLRGIKTQMYLEDDDDNIGSPIIRIGKDWVVGEDSTAVMVVTRRTRRDGEWESEVDSWLEYEAPEGDDEDDEEEEEEELEEELDDEEEEDDEEDEDEDEDEDEEVEDEAEEEEEEDEEEEETAPPVKPAKRAVTRPVAAKAATPKPTAARPVARSSAPAPKAAKAAKASGRPVARGKVKRGGSEEPPF